MKFVVVMHSRGVLLLERERVLFETSPPWGIKARPLSAQNPMEWDVVMLGPPDSVWQDGWFLLSVLFPANYDQSPPKIVFKTIPFHPNVEAETGEVCMDVLNPEIASSTFSPKVCLQTILVMLQTQLDCPVLENAVNAEAAHMYLHSRKAYNKIARQCVETTRRVQAGMPPFEAFDQDTAIINDALHRAVIVPAPPATPEVDVAVATSKPRPVVSFDSYFASWSQMGSTLPLHPSQAKESASSTLRDTNKSHTKPPSLAGTARVSSKHGPSSTAVARIPSGNRRPVEDDDDDDEAEELCKWTQGLKTD